MKPIEIKKGIYWVGAVDWNVRSFHGHTYSTKRGTSYNAYLIIDEKIALIDTVYGPFAAELIERIREIVSPDKIDYVIANHVESDHSGAMPELMRLCPKARVFGTAKCKEGLYRHYYENWDFQIVKTGDTLRLGRRTLTFVEAPMLHWPDSMFTYCPEEKLLFPNDAFGQHYATSKKYDDEVDACALMAEAAAYYANILWPLGSLVLKKIEDVQKMGIPIDMIAPSHGVIWRKDPTRIVNAYLAWAKNTVTHKAVIAYETMWQSTARMARAIAEGLSDCGVPVTIYDIAQSDRTDVITDMLDAKAFLVGSSTHDNDLLPTVASFLAFLKGLKPKGRIGAAFGSFGWAGGAVASVERELKDAGVMIAQPAVQCRFRPDPNDLKACYEFGRGMAQQIRA